MPSLLSAKRSPQRSPERQALADAIIGSRQIETRLTTAAADKASAFTAKVDAQGRLEAAQAAFEQAKLDTGLYLLAVASGNAGAPPPTIREAREAITDAQDQLDAAAGIYEAATAEHEAVAAAASNHFVVERLRDLAMNVIRAEGRAAADAVAAQVRQAYDDLLLHGSTLEWLAGARMFAVVTDVGSLHGRPADETLRRALQAVTNVRAGNAYTRYPDGSAPWGAALAALLTDADAPLPLAKGPPA